MGLPKRAPKREPKRGRTRGQIRTGVAAVTLLATLATLATLAACGGSGGDHKSKAIPGFELGPGGSGTATPSASGSGTDTPPSPPPPPPDSSGGTTTTAPPAAKGQLPARVESDGATITVGNPSAKHTVLLYEDPRCEPCGVFEKVNGARLTALAQAGKLRIQYALASFVDNNDDGNGSKRAVNALRAAVEQNGFPAYHAVVFAHQPIESSDGFTDDRLLSLAAQVKGLDTPAFQAAVTSGGYLDFVTRSETAFMASKVAGTPAVRIHGELARNKVEDLEDPDLFNTLLKQHGIS
jgi:protein-disulfide isomerase